MKVKIVTEKSDCEMTIEELGKCTKPIGFHGTDGIKSLLGGCPNGYVFTHYDTGNSGEFWGFGTTIQRLLTNSETNGTFYVFDTAKELYSWMAE